MHARKIDKGNLLAVLFLIGIFAAGVTLGSLLTAATMRKEPEAVITESSEPAEETDPAEETEPQTEPEVQPTSVVIEEPQLTDLGEFKLTAYCDCEKCCGEWADGITYTGTQATAGRTVAVDPDVIPLGSTVYINGAEYIAEDIGGAIQGKRIDVLFPTHQEALQFGVQYASVSIK